MTRKQEQIVATSSGERWHFVIFRISVASWHTVPEPCLRGRRRPSRIGRRTRRRRIPKRVTSTDSIPAQFHIYPGSQRQNGASDATNTSPDLNLRRWKNWEFGVGRRAANVKNASCTNIFQSIFATLRVNAVQNTSKLAKKQITASGGFSAESNQKWVFKKSENRKNELEIKL